MARKFVKKQVDPKLKLSKKNIQKFKKSAAPKDVVMIDEIANEMEVEELEVKDGLKKMKRLTTKRVLRLQKKEAMKKCLDAKRIKTKAGAVDAMDGAEPVVEEEHPTRVNKDRLHAYELPIQRFGNKPTEKARLKELMNSNVVTGRRMSKKKARKIMRDMNRDQKEKERLKAAMDQN